MSPLTIHQTNYFVFLAHILGYQDTTISSTLLHAKRNIGTANYVASTGSDLVRKGWYTKMAHRARISLFWTSLESTLYYQLLQQLVDKKKSRLISKLHRIFIFKSSGHILCFTSKLFLFNHRKMFRIILALNLNRALRLLSTISWFKMRKRSTQILELINKKEMSRPNEK